MRIPRCTTLLAAVLLTSSAYAQSQAGQTIQFQGHLASAGVPMNSTVDVTASLHDQATGGTVVWTEAQAAVTFQDGYFNLTLGDNTSLTTVDFGRQLWLEVTIDQSPAVTLTPRLLLQSVPYANFAHALSTDGATADGQVLMYDLSTGATRWGTVSGGGGGGTLTLPFAGSDANTGISLSVTNTGGGEAGHFETTSATGAVPTLSAVSHSTTEALLGLAQGTGSAAFFDIENTASTANTVEIHTNGEGEALRSRNTGNGRAGHFRINNQNNEDEVVFAETNGQGDVVYAKHDGVNGRAGLLTISSSENPKPALEVATSGTGAAGTFTIYNDGSEANAVYAETSGTGRAVSAYHTGVGEAGKFQISNSSSNMPALQGLTDGSGDAVNGYMTGTGSAGYFQVNNLDAQVPAVYGLTNSGGDGVSALTIGSGRAVRGQIFNASSAADAVSGETNGTGDAVSGTSESGYGVFGESNSEESAGVRGIQAGAGTGVEGAALSGIGVSGVASSGTGVNGSSASGSGVYGAHTQNGNYGELGTANAGVNGWTNSNGSAVYGQQDGELGSAIHGKINHSLNPFNGVRGTTISGQGIAAGVLGESTATSGGIGVRGTVASEDGHAGLFEGRVEVRGELTWDAKTSYITVAAAAFEPHGAVEGFRQAGAEVTTAALSTPDTLFAPVQLPHNANLQQVTFYYRTVAPLPANSIGYGLFYNDFTSSSDRGTAYAWIDAPSAATGSMEAQSTSSFSRSNVVENDEYSYYLKVLVNAGIQFRAVVIQYTTTEPY